MLKSNVVLYPGSTLYGAFLEIHVSTALPFQWLQSSRQVLSFLLEGFNESDLPNGAHVRAFGVRLLSWLFPLPAQFHQTPGNGIPTNPPPAAENGGFYLTENGLALRFGEASTFEDLEAIHRALLALACFNAYELNDPTRKEFFSLIDAFRPNAAALSDLLLSNGLPEGYKLDNGEKESVQRIVNDRRPELLTRAFDAASRNNARFFSALARLASIGKLDHEGQELFLHWVAVGLDAAPDE